MSASCWWPSVDMHANVSLQPLTLTALPYIKYFPLFNIKMILFLMAYFTQSFRHFNCIPYSRLLTWGADFHFFHKAK